MTEKFRLNAFDRGAFVLGPALISFIAACGGPTESRLQDSSYQNATVLAFSGGFNSCVRDARGNLSPAPMETTHAINAMRERLKNAGIEQFITAISCFAFARNNAEETIYFMSDVEPGQLKTGKRQDFYDLVATLSQTPEYNTHIAGHSYGGWSTMQMIKDMPPSKIHSLTTIDPISPIRCRPNNFILGGTASASGERGCMQAPADISSGERQEIAHRTGTWRNFFQEDFQPLHSSIIELADDNVKLSYPSRRPNAHSRITNDARVWTAVERQILADASAGDDVSQPEPNEPGDDDQTGEPDLPSSDFYFALSPRDDSGQVNLYLATGVKAAWIGLCTGEVTDCKQETAVSETFELQNKNWPERWLYKLKSNFSPARGANFTVIAKSQAGETVGAASFQTVTMATAIPTP